MFQRPEGFFLPLFVLFLFYTASWYSHATYRLIWLGDVQYYSALLLSIIAVFCIVSNIKTYFPSRDYHLNRAYFAVIFLLLNAFLMTMYSSSSQAWHFFWEDILKFALFSLMIVVFVRNDNALYAFVLIWFIVFLKIVQEGIWGIVGGGLLWENQEVLRLHGSVPQYKHPNSLSGYFIGGLPFLVAFYQLTESRLRYLFIAVMVMTLVCIIATGSRTGYVTLFVLSIIYLWNLKKLPMSLLVICLGVMFVLPKLLPFSSEYIDRIYSIWPTEQTDVAGSSSVNKRIIILEDAWEIIKKHPFGVGTKAFTEHRQLEFGRFQETHNLYLEIWADFGLQGLLCFLVFIYSIYKALLSNRKLLLSRISSLREDLLDQKIDSSNYMESSEYQATSQNFLICKRLLMIGWALEYFIICRLLLGIWGHDFYEIYWGFIFGLSVVILRLSKFHFSLDKDE